MAKISKTHHITKKGVVKKNPPKKEIQYDYLKGGNDWMDSYEDNDLIGDAIREVFKKKYGNEDLYEVYVLYHELGDGKHAVFFDEIGDYTTRAMEINAWSRRGDLEGDVDMAVEWMRGRGK